jgi:hypothetical protein
VASEQSDRLLEITGRSPLRRRRSALDCRAIEEEEEEEEEEEIIISVSC